MLPPPGYLIWANEPVPFPGTTVTNCYPPEFLKSYTPVSAGVTASSIVPVMSPLVCPSNFCTQRVGEDNYIACCPSGYQFQAPATPQIRDRPFYGGTCYSEFSVSKSATVLKYGEDGQTDVELWAATTTGANAYAHPIDGFAISFPTLGCAAQVSSLSLASSPSGSNTTSTSSSSRDPRSSSFSSSSTAAAGVTVSSLNTSSTISPGTIAGAVIGSVVGLATIIGLVFFLLYRRKHAQSQSDPKAPQFEDDMAGLHHEKNCDVVALEIGTSGRSLSYTNSGRHTYEMDAQSVHEMPVRRE
ncbi:hypothetical protein P153DRAFT_392955 [Dothidotthia symphoricarpi CBS 119687]|uniref:Uncharacterized protein n=1 Tax=Dothidotthia symphoricarpi CBS 119687 TaxID=1392245 RepID=A0A6A6AQG7_9PLEO|nr:uncharacterized protein P153DRAFT_392955 [Dothidotthia symphoricarpi CBS 119687]KAF2133097.1 hypothetical protein P153DRAFT_392955 [Dothidotthia symphoricarpi CBS 119687]